ncbi:hypothetical protein F5878DRAFT_200703 [Lentinula raphanica]|uniref:Uncharacterized protein n=1 Tax=Lentinula raphanica TaxID=153919 RepID=A0AA38PJQ8_9AGAR|nr:hypothetical protein F5878DRAFT_200703 [Lentinula raphanica]
MLLRVRNEMKESSYSPFGRGRLPFLLAAFLIQLTGHVIFPDLKNLDQIRRFGFFRSNRKVSRYLFPHDIFRHPLYVTFLLYPLFFLSFFLCSPSFLCHETASFVPSRCRSPSSVSARLIYLK